MAIVSKSTISVDITFFVGAEPNGNVAGDAHYILENQPFILPTIGMTFNHVDTSSGRTYTGTVAQAHMQEMTYRLVGDDVHLSQKVQINLIRSFSGGT